MRTRRRRPRRNQSAHQLVRVTAALLALSALLACAIIGTEERPAPGGAYREAVVGQPLSLNPLLHPHDPITADVSRLVYAGLVRVVDDGRVEGDLAEGWTTSDDGRVYTFRLRPRATWHDGRPVTSDDVLATVALLQAPTYAGPRELGAFWQAVRVEAPDRETVRFLLAEPYAGFVEACSFAVLPRHLFGISGDANLGEHPNSYTPVGAGPFKVQQVDAAGITLTRHDGYPGTRPLLDEVRIRYFPDPAAALDALGDGAVDGVAGLERSDIETVQNPERFTVRQAPVHGHQTILSINHRNQTLADPAVRRALAAAVQREVLVDGPLRGQAVAAYGPVPAFTWAYDRDVEVAPSPALAAQLLEAAGWTGAPVRSRAGRQLRLRLVESTDGRQVGLAEALASQLGAVGMGVEVQPTDALDLYRERLVPGDFDLALLGVWLGTVDPDPYPLWHSSQGSAGLNFGGYQSPRADQLLAAARLDGDPTRRLAALTAFQETWLDEVPGVVLANPVLTYTVASQFRGVRLGTLTDPSARFQHLDEWHLRTQRVPALPR